MGWYGPSVEVDADVRCPEGSLRVDVIEKKREIPHQILCPSGEPRVGDEARGGERIHSRMRSRELWPDVGVVGTVLRTSSLSRMSIWISEVVGGADRRRRGVLAPSSTFRGTVALVDLGWRMRLGSRDTRMRF